MSVTSYLPLAMNLARPLTLARAMLWLVAVRGERQG